MRLLASLLVVMGLQAAPPLKDVLHHTGRAVETFWTQFAAVNCNENVTQLKLDAKGKAQLHQESNFDYLVMMHMADDDVAVEESRVKVKAAGNAKDAPMLVTNGFSTLLLIFHPFYQGSFEFSTPEEADAMGKRAYHVSFRQLHGARSPSCLRLRGRDYPLEWRGEAWIDTDTGAILRVTAALQNTMEDLGLRSLSADVLYSSVRFTGEQETWWLPATATVEAETLKQHWRNIHRFSNYRHFAVSTKSKTEGPN